MLRPYIAPIVAQCSTRTITTSSLWMAAWTKDGPKFDTIWSKASIDERRDLAFATNEHGWNCLHHASVHNQTHMIEKLLFDGDFGHELSETSVRNGWRPLHYASGFGQKESVDLLLRGGASLEIKNDKSFACMDWTPWHRAVRWWLSPGKPNCIDHLLSIGVNAAAVAGDGKTAAHIANPEVHKALDSALKMHLEKNPNNPNVESVKELRIGLKKQQESFHV